MKIYILYDCVESAYEWAYAGVENIYLSREEATTKMKELYEECLKEHQADDQDSQNDTYLNGWDARVADVPAGFRHTWTITEREL